MWEVRIPFKKIMVVAYYRGFFFLLTSCLTKKSIFLIGKPCSQIILKYWNHQIQDSGNICPVLYFYHYDDDDEEDKILYHEIHLFKMFHSLVLNIFIELGNYYYYLILENCHWCQKNLVPISSQSLFILPILHPLTITNLLSGAIDLPILGIVYKWSHKICGLLCLPFFSWHSFFKVLLYYLNDNYLIPIYSCVSLLWICHICLSIHWLRFSHFWLLWKILL